MTPENFFQERTFRSGPKSLPNGQRAHLETLNWQGRMETCASLAAARGTTTLEEFINHWISYNDRAKGQPTQQREGTPELRIFGPSDSQIAKNTSRLARQLSQANLHGKA